ncbi:MAG: class I SAM-dependent methyltransferase [Methylophilaceae bacterium]
MNLKLSHFYFILILLLTITPSFSGENTALVNSINDEQRSEQNRARDGARHPQQTLAFFDVKSNTTVLEIWPGKGWYTEILAPTLKQGGGQFIAAGFPLNAGAQWRQEMQQEYQDYLASKPSYYDAVSFVEIGPPSLWSLGKDNSVDTVLTFRNVHNWVKGGYEKEMFYAMYQVLKPGGVLGVVEHRAKVNTDIETMNKSGYLTEKFVIDLAQEAGFVLEGSSEINANEKDTKDHAKGVWTLPPTLRLGDDNREKYLAIGESDRMTLKFIKQ